MTTKEDLKWLNQAKGTETLDRAFTLTDMTVATDRKRIHIVMEELPSDLPPDDHYTEEAFLKMLDSHSDMEPFDATPVRTKMSGDSELVEIQFGGDSAWYRLSYLEQALDGMDSPSFSWQSNVGKPEAGTLMVMDGNRVALIRNWIVDKEWEEES